MLKMVPDTKISSYVIVFYASQDVRDFGTWYEDSLYKTAISSLYVENLDGCKHETRVQRKQTAGGAWREKSWRHDSTRKSLGKRL